MASKELIFTIKLAIELHHFYADYSKIIESYQGDILQATVNNKCNIAYYFRPYHIICEF